MRKSCFQEDRREEKILFEFDENFNWSSASKAFECFQLLNIRTGN